MNDNTVIRHRMPKAIKAKWLKALRSGGYNKTKDILYKYDADGKGNPGFCCLGVLEHCLTGGVEFDDEQPLGIPSEEFLNDYGIEFKDDYNEKCNNPIFIYTGIEYSASYLNDTLNLSFKQIANIIEEQVEGF